MIFLLNALARLVTFLLLAILALVGLAVAIFSIGGGEDGVSLPGLADLVGLPQLRDRVGELLAIVEGGGVDAVPALAGLAAIALGVLLIVGAVVSPRERLVILLEGDEGTLAARRRALGQMAAALADQERDLTPRRVKVRPRRRGSGGRVDLAVDHPVTAEQPSQRTVAALEPLTRPFQLSTRVRTRAASRVR